MAVQIKLFIGNSNVVEMSGLRANDVSGVYINDATVTCTITDLNGTEVAGQTWPLTMDYQTGSNGIYQATLPAGLSLTEDASYLVIVDAVASEGTFKRTQEARAVRR